MASAVILQMEATGEGRTEHVTTRLTPSAKAALEQERGTTPMSEYVAKIVAKHLGQPYQ